MAEVRGFGAATTDPPTFSLDAVLEVSDVEGVVVEKEDQTGYPTGAGTRLKLPQTDR